MRITLDFHSKEPIYTQIVGQVEKWVATGALKPGAQLPTVRELAADLQVNFNTIARAYRLLHEARIISTQQGRGTFVLEQPPPVDMSVSRRVRLADLIAGWLAEADGLGYGPDEVERAWDERLAAWKESKAKESKGK